MRILFYFNDRLLEDRGTPSRGRNLAASLAALRGVELVALSRDGRAEAKRGLPFEHISIRDLPRRGLDLAPWIDELRPDVLYGQTHKAMPALAAHRSRHSPALVADLHGDLAGEKLEDRSRGPVRRLRSFLSLRLAERRLLPRMGAFTLVSTALARRLRDSGRPSLVLWGGVDPGHFRPLEAPPTERLRVAYAGNFRGYQGVDVLLQAAEELISRGEPFDFRLIGQHEEAPEIARWARSLPPGRVELVGPRPYQEMPRHLADAQVLVIPRPRCRSATYGFPSKLPEYLAMGKAVVVTDVGDQGKVVEDRKSGIVIPPDSPAELVHALLRLQDPDLRLRLGEAARALAVESFSWQAVAERTLGFLREVRTGRPGTS